MNMHFYRGSPQEYLFFKLSYYNILGHTTEFVACSGKFSSVWLLSKKLIFTSYDIV